MIEFDLNFLYEGAKSPALKNVKGKVDRGKCIVLCGGSGCGKSTLLRCINHLVPQFYEGELKGACYIDGRDTSQLSIGEMGGLAASVFQDPRSQFFTINSSTEVAFGMENHCVPQDEMVERTEEAFALFSLERLKNRNVYELSSGEKQLVSILSAWALDTDILLLDEPTANLDYGAICQLRELLMKLKEQGKTMIISEHRLYYLSALADEYWLIEDGKLRGQFTEEEVKTLQREGRAPLRTFSLQDIVYSANRAAQLSQTAAFTFSAEAIRFRYRKNTEILYDISFEASVGEIVGIIGANGSGKTTLGKILAGLLRPYVGNIYVDGKSCNHRELQKKVLFVLQESEFQFYTSSVMNELQYGNKHTPIFEEEAERLLKSVGMWECRNRHPFTLSGGQMQKLSLLIAYYSSKQVVILDEPTAGLDAESLQACAELIREMQKNKLVFVITHDIELIAQVCTKCICVADGKISQEVSLTDNKSLSKLVEYMKSPSQQAPSGRSTKSLKCGNRLHPAVKLMIWLVVMIAISLPNNNLLIFANLALVLMLLADGWMALASISGGILLLILAADVLLNGTSLYFFVAILLPRVLVASFATYPLIGRDEATRTIACFRAMHVPEVAIMVLSVIFRFFPALTEDMHLMRQSVQTRSAYSTLGQKLLSLPEYLEILTVPMALRVIRIAETLSASAETRGIALGGKRSSYIRLRFGPRDVVLLLLLIVILAIEFAL